ncbi:MULTISPECIES: LysR family transcriptional regulator [Streptosporangium]|uniref:DNA-binding transcriptional LysR family regulator n=1 Tax=Streptosporangium brasiliense TaxID=47480 RepID=A0ABT9R6B8_9ACTN|nr:LysR family transcriptional regulator [Streptosporangium brasiliense]MDP9864683.1 DNA-binding transcriptional LysR family regulator [Streptosporangium brasiliense]
MNWQELETFLTLAEELHFGRAAERLHVSRARVSQMTKALERRVGAPLFERTSRRVALTPLGRQLRDDLDPHHHGILAALAKAADAARGTGGVLRVGFSSPHASELVTTVIERFRGEHPRCEVQIREVHLSDRFGPLRRGELDIQLIELPVDEPDLTVGPVLLRDPTVLALSSGHRLAGRTTVSLEDLADETVLIIDGMSGYFRERHFPERTPGGRPIHHSTSTTYWQELLALVAAGEGVTIAAAQGARYYPRPNLVYLPIEDAPPLEYALLWRTAGVSAKGLAFTRMAAEVSTAARGSGSV